MNWSVFIAFSFITIGGFIAAVYEVIAKKMGLPVGNLFSKNGLFTFVGSICVFATLISSFFYNPWWAVLILFVIGLVFSQLIVHFFRVFSPLISVLLMIIGLIVFLLA